MRHLILIAALILAGLSAPAAKAQDLASLVADRVAIAGNDKLVAQGNVEVFHQGKRLKASRIVYDRAADTLLIDGPIVLTDGAGTIILADQAELSGDLTDGILRSARLVLNQQLQLAASQMMRVGGRYTSLGKTVASSCKICAANPTPLWEIRANRVVHDQLERQIYFDSAQLRVVGIPVFWIPHLRIPDPTLDRASGFLAPTIRTTSDLGFGIKVPYFIRMGDSRDLTVTPYLSSKNGRTLALRYRQAFANGTIELNGALSRDDILANETRSYLFTEGAFNLPRNFKLTFSTETVSDDAYLLDYGISSKDRLDSQIEVSRTRRNEYISGRLINFYSLRSDENNSTLPSIVSDLTWQRRFSPDLIGGEGSLQFQTHSHYRSSTDPADLNGDGIGDGRDVARASITADWRRNWMLPAGVLASGLGEVNADFYSIAEDTTYEGDTARIQGAAAVELRWPWVRASAGGASHVVEPIVQLIWSSKDNSSIPNEDSVLTEYDESSLFSLSRFPGADAVERGPRANIGIGYTRYDPAGWSAGLTFGRVIRSQDFDQFSDASGLDGERSDWLGAIQITGTNGLSMTNRLVFGDDLSMTKAELRLDLQKEDYGMSSSYIWVLADATEDRDADVSELNLDGRYRFTPSWEGALTTRYDFQAQRAASAGLTFAFRNECLKVDVSVSRRFTSSSAVTASTSFGLSVDLLGFGGKGTIGPARVCSG